MKPSLPLNLVLFLALGISLLAGPVAADPVKSEEEVAGKEEKPAPEGNKKPKAKANPGAKAKAKAKPKAQPKKEEQPEAKEDTEEKEKPEEPKLHEVKRETLEVKTKLSGLVEGVKATPVSLDLDRWATLAVIRALPHGTEVKEGDILVQLETADLEKKIADLRKEMPLKRLELKTAEDELAKMEETTPISLESALRNREQAEEDLSYFEKVSRPMREKDAKEDVKSAENYLAYATEELNQLKKMYEADDLTEETEEIILQRAQNSVDEYTWMLEQTRERSRRTLETSIPREHERLLSSVELQRINWRAGEKSMRDALEKKRLEVAASQKSLEESEKSLAEHESDLEALSVRAPHAGIVYHGMSQRGKWITAAAVERKLIPGGKLTMNEIVMTVVDPARLQLRVMAPENKVADLEPGQSAEITLVVDPDSKKRGKVKSVSPVPLSDQTFDTVLTIAPNEEGKAVFPGMKAEAEITTYRNEKALVVPKSAVRKEDEKSVVTLENGRDQVVEVGRTSGDRVEILKGLKEGQKVRAGAKPEEKKEESSDEKKEGEDK